ncbi:MAG: dipeptidase [Myxococcota bacterium]
MNGWAWVCLLALSIEGCGGEPHVPEPAAPDPSPSEAPTEEAAGDQAEDDPEPAEVPPEPEPLLAIDTHVDTTLRMLDDDDDIGERLSDGHLDLVRMREGGLHAAFFSVWVNPRRYRGEAAWRRALAMTETIREVATRHPEQAAVCRSAEEVRAAVREGKIALLIGVEGAHAFGSDDEATVLRRLREIYELGARYLTITWSTDNPLGHSSTGDAPARGLTPLGRRVVREMNALGMIIDVSHVSDPTFSDIMDITTRPVFASHSSARALSDHPRNMDDAMIRRVAEAGGAVCVNYFSNYVDAEYLARRRRAERRHRRAMREIRAQDLRYSERGRAERNVLVEVEPDLDPPDLETLGDHFAHIVSVGGPEAACLGSDFDGVSELPVGLDDVSQLGALYAELERRELPLRPILGENVLRILAAQETSPAAPTE